MFYMVWLVLGIVLTIPLLLFAQRLKYRTLTLLFGRSLLVAALIYLGFAVLWGTSTWVVIELAGVAAYGLFYWLALRSSLIWLSFGWLLHPVWDLVLHMHGPGAHVAPHWYAVACLSFDVVVAGYILYRVIKQRRTTSPEPVPENGKTLV